MAVSKFQAQLADINQNGLIGAQQSAITSLTDSSGGTANDTVQSISGTYTQAEVANNFADVTAKINAILAALRAHGLIAG